MIFLMHFARLIVCILTAWLKTSQGSKVCQCAFHSILMSSMMLCVWRSLVVPCFSLSCFSPSSTSSLPHSTCSLPGTPSSMSSPPRINTTALTHNEEHCHHGDIQSSHRLRAQAPSTTSTTQRLLQRSSRTNPATKIRSLRIRAMRNSTMRFSEKRYFHHCSFRSEKNQRTGDKLITLMKKVCCQLSPFPHTQVRGYPYTNLVRVQNENQVAKWKMKESGLSLKDKKSKFSLKLESRSRSTNFRPILTEEVSGIEWNY